MTPPARGYLRLCSSVLAPLVLLALLSPHSEHRTAAHLEAARRHTGVIPAIPPPPLQMRLAPATWKGFPWSQLGKYSSEIMLMSYWSFRSGCPQLPLNCAYQFTKYNVILTRQLTGGRVPIHVIGGVGDHINGTQLRQFVQGAVDAHADGASLYDVGTTQPLWWSALAALRALGP